MGRAPLRLPGREQRVPRDLFGSSPLATHPLRSNPVPPADKQEPKPRPCDPKGGGRDRTYDLDVMSVPSYHCSTPPCRLLGEGNLPPKKDGPPCLNKEGRATLSASPRRDECSKPERMNRQQLTLEALGRGLEPLHLRLGERSIGREYGTRHSDDAHWLNLFAESLALRGFLIRGNLRRASSERPWLTISQRVFFTTS